MTTSALPAIRRVTPAEVQASANRALLLDVRSPAEFEGAHIAGSILHPLGELDFVAVQKLAAEKSECVIICRSGNRARQAAEKLVANGLANLQVLEGGLIAWEAAGLPLERGRETISLERQVRIAAGALVLTGVVLGWLVNPALFGLSAFVGAGLVFAGITDTCAMGLLLAKMPWNQRRS